MIKIARKHEVMAKSIVILANDPGTTNYGFAIVKATMKQTTAGRTLDFSILEHGLIPSTVRTLKNGKQLIAEIKAYLMTIQGLRIKHIPVAWIAERYMTRGIKGSTIEMVAIMMGSVLGKYHKKMRFKFIIAAEWKNQVNKRGDLKEFYKAVRPYRITPHQVDACFIGIYGAHRWAGLKGFEFLPKNIGEMICTAPCSTKK